VRTHGYPVPAIEEVRNDGAELVMERIDGPSIVAMMSRRPWSFRPQGAMLADLHCRLHEISGPEWIPPAPGAHGDHVLHLDLHPLNVIVSQRGPVVIDWSNASRGSPTWTSRSRGC
jgi:tRNA A-37 threonylcarbamoyl transferase component Bud32